MNITFEDYYAIHPGRMDEEEFDAYIPSALMFVETITANRARSATGYKAERVKYAVCAVINEMAAQAAARGSGGARVSSVSNEGYTESYGSLSSAASEESVLRSAAFRYLSGTGLMSAL